jgi:hypothetical protein
MPLDEVPSSAPLCQTVDVWYHVHGHTPLRRQRRRARLADGQRGAGIREAEDQLLQQQ